MIPPVSPLIDPSTLLSDPTEKEIRQTPPAHTRKETRTTTPSPTRNEVGTTPEEPTQHKQKSTAKPNQPVTASAESRSYNNDIGIEDQE